MPARVNGRRRRWAFYRVARVLADADVLGLEVERGAIYCAFRRDATSRPRLAILLPPDSYDSRAVRRWEQAQTSRVSGGEFLELLHGDNGRGGLGLRVLEDDGPGRGLHVGWDPESQVQSDRNRLSRLTGIRPSRRRGWRLRGQEDPWLRS